MNCPNCDSEKHAIKTLGRNINIRSSNYPGNTRSTKYICLKCGFVYNEYATSPRKIGVINDFEGHI